MDNRQNEFRKTNALVDRFITATLLDEELRAETEKIATQIGAGKPWSDAQFRFFGSPWLRQWLMLDPAPNMAKMRGPVLAIFGAEDIQVDAESNAAAARTALSSNADAKVEILPKHNHLFQETLTGNVGSPTGTAPSQKTLDLMAAWITATKPRADGCTVD